MQNLCTHFYPCNARYMPCQSHSPWFVYLFDIYRRAKIMTVSNLNFFRSPTTSVFGTIIIFCIILYYLLYFFLENNLYFSFKLRKPLYVSNRLHGSYYFTFFSKLLRQIYPKWNRCNRNIKENVEFCLCADV
jgi:hypothetical protein